MKKKEDWEREEAGEKRLQQLEAWLENRPLLNKLYCHVLIRIVGLTHAEAIFSFLWMMFFVFMALVMALICLLIDYLATTGDAQTWLASHYSDSMSGVTSSVAFGACGLRHPSNGSFTNGGTEGNYWSSGPGGGGAWHMEFLGSRIGVRSNDLGFGFSVRLFRD